jgi:hypothetical protein
VPDVLIETEMKEEKITTNESSIQLGSPKERRLAIEIARCSQVAVAEGDSSHPCSKVVNFQKDFSDRHVPEAWFGNLANAHVLFVSSNPSIDMNVDETGENYPRAGWTNEKIGEWMTRRVDPSWDQVPVTFGHSTHKNFLWRCIDGEYRGAKPTGMSPQQTWNSIHLRAKELLGVKTDPSKNYALTELVHCKSTNAHGVPEAMSECTKNWLDPIFEIAENVNLIILTGSHVRPWCREKFAGEVPKDIGARVSVGGLSVAKRDSFVSQQIGGVNRVFCFLPHPGSSEPGGKSFGVRFGVEATQALGKIARGERAIPQSTKDLHNLF